MFECGGDSGGDDGDLQRCEKWKERAWNDPLVQFLRTAMAASGCSISRDYIECVRCDAPGISGGLDVDETAARSRVLLCANRVRSYAHTATTCAHELIHAFDYCRAHVRFAELRHLACTEIRAANLSGDCHFLREIDRGHLHIAKQHQACVRRRAVKSVMASAACESQQHAEAAVDDVFATCFADTAPFERIP